MAQSILIMSFGQSNADVYTAFPTFQAPVLNDPSILVPDDGLGFRGRRGQFPAPLMTGFLRASTLEEDGQSLGVSAAAIVLAREKQGTDLRVIARSGGKTGRPMIGYKREHGTVDGILANPDGSVSNVLLAMVEDIFLIAEAADKAGHPLSHVYLPLFHGEADRKTLRDDYTKHMLHVIDHVDSALSEIGIGTDWLLTQPSGTGEAHAGNDWENRLSLFDIAVARDNAHLVATNYAYPLDDPSHLSATARALLGELIGHQITALRHGNRAGLATVKQIHIAGRTIDLTFQSLYGLTIDTTRFPAPTHPCGFHVSGQEGQGVEQVIQLDARTIRLICKEPVLVPGGPIPTLDYAYARNKRSEDGTKGAFPAGRGCLREDWETHSRILPGQEVLRWVPGFSYPLALEIPAAV